MSVLAGGPKYGTPWSRDELILALYLYCQIPFAQTKAGNPEVIRLASVIGRTPAAVARKLGNLGAFDPVLAERGVSGLTHFSKADSEVWQSFSSDWPRLIAEAQHILAGGEWTTPPESPPEGIIVRPPGATETTRPVSVRLCQGFFRRAVLASYAGACCMCGIDIPALLTASHIVPWAADETNRANPRNGLCLCALHDRAFDCGILMIHPFDLTVCVADRVVASRNPAVHWSLTNLNGKHIRLPDRFTPAPEFLAWHAENVYHTNGIAGLLDRHE